MICIFCVPILFLQQVNMKLAKFDELDTLIKGILFAEIQNRTECYYYENARDIMYVIEL